MSSLQWFGSLHLGIILIYFGVLGRCYRVESGEDKGQAETVVGQVKF